MKDFFKISLALMLMAGLFSCNKDKNNPGYEYYPDMAHSPAYRTYSTNPIFADGMTMRKPAEGTIPRGYMPYPFKAKSFQDQVDAGLQLQNPIPVDDAVLAEGKRQYEIFCMDCHGEIGDGNGYLYTSKLFTAKPQVLTGSYVQGKPDGEIYHVITVGSLSGLMGGHGSQILPENRWKIIHYVRTLAAK